MSGGRRDIWGFEVGTSEMRLCWITRIGVSKEFREPACEGTFKSHRRLKRLEAFFTTYDGSGDVSIVGPEAQMRLVTSFPSHLHFRCCFSA